MENKIAQPQEKGKFFAALGRKKKVIFMSMTVLVLICLFGRGIAYHPYRAMGGRRSMSAGNVVLAEKDFEPMGVVFADSSASRRNGYNAVYNALMKEASQKGGDAITNVNIFFTREFLNRTWSGSALAIKYLD